jgi:CBS domain-containing protein
MTTSVRQVLASKGSAVYSISPQTSVTEALDVMAEKNVGSVVVAAGDRLVGVFSERDYARKVRPCGEVKPETPVEDLMSCNVLTVSPTQTVEDCMSLMTDNRVRHLPVVERGKLVGIITIGDVVKAMLAEQQSTIQQLSSYIAGDLSA